VIKIKHVLSELREALGGRSREDALVARRESEADLKPIIDKLERGHIPHTVYCSVYVPGDMEMAAMDLLSGHSEPYKSNENIKGRVAR
jgi:hypothetical protein